MSDSKRKSVAIVGAGPVGALAGLYFSHLGWAVTIYELRGDLRLPSNRTLGSGKSINLALSERGINGLRNIGDNEILLNKVLEFTIPMVGRMIHKGKIGEEGEGQDYDPVLGRFIRSADRALLNMQLLDALEEREGVELMFGWKLRGMKLQGPEGAEVEVVDAEGQTQTKIVNLVVGADGAHSAVRNQLQRHVRMYYEQTYINTLWCEFNIQPHPVTGDFQLSKNHLHIWPKQTQMFIAIPSMDKSFTCTLFAPEECFDAIKTKVDLITFFTEHYPDVLKIIGAESLADQYFNNEHLPLVSIRTGPYHYKDRCVIIGDAAHAMVPFYGQGMNAGFESVNVLMKHIRENPNDLGKALQDYTDERKPDAWAIVELAMRNYDEMRSGVTKRGYLLRKWVEEACAKWVPRLGVKTLYSMVSFGNDRYSMVLRKAESQGRAEERVFAAVLVAALAGAGYRAGIWRALQVGLRASVDAFMQRR
ncbi:hypothetical protein FPQ18DRAFT_323974 [Pyronema domesticum]|uniref:Kynurenine 3-monooxygenase n=1 Tax=Pyronema omphalodes (strain CBS 100304) TaxID=1076935 RepID=U4KY11_PYROM|nr:hypothetical protein FPQ18DRAFT_323974 [Pyronema domesticum]CCX06841.1 Similar to Kynurenine 3-monooxygenase; acc. no. Q2GQG8 [Pyronema omphalodes CBS 100304]